jgi:hypothetical protein
MFYNEVCYVVGLFFGRLWVWFPTCQTILIPLEHLGCFTCCHVVVCDWPTWMPHVYYTPPITYHVSSNHLPCVYLSLTTCLLTHLPNVSHVIRTMMLCVILLVMSCGTLFRPFFLFEKNFKTSYLLDTMFIWSCSRCIEKISLSSTSSSHFH